MEAVAIFSEYMHVIEQISLFSGIDRSGIEAVLVCLGARLVSYSRDDIILLAGARPDHMGAVLSGGAHVVKDDVDGNRQLIAALGAGDIYAEALCSAGLAESPVSVIAQQESVIMQLDFSRVYNSCEPVCPHHGTLIRNMLQLLARKNLFLQSRLEVVATKTIREKVLKYLGFIGAQRGVPIKVPLNRERMADYLSVERSALSHELMRMKRDGVIDYNRDTFILM